MTNREKAAGLLDPVLYQDRILCRTLWAKQQDIIRSVLTHPQTAVAGSHASGKSFCGFGIVLWWLSRFTDAKVFTTSANATPSQKPLARHGGSAPEVATSQANLA